MGSRVVGGEGFLLNRRKNKRLVVFPGSPRLTEVDPSPLSATLALATLSATPGSELAAEI